jgi:hypothetical protein
VTESGAVVIGKGELIETGAVNPSGPAHRCTTGMEETP